MNDTDRRRRHRESNGLPLTGYAARRPIGRPDGVPTSINVTYYEQRASFGLTVIEGTQPSDDGGGYLLTPGIYTPEHIAGWKHATGAVHAAGGRLGRIAHR